MIPTEVFEIVTKFIDSFNTIGDQCYIWNGLIDSSGFPCLFHKLKKVLIHRISYEIYNEDFNPKLKVLQNCKNRLCIKPEHLYQDKHWNNSNDRGTRYPESYLIDKYDFMQKFYSFQNKQDEDGCWEWKGRLNKSNYGVLDYNFHSYFAHRISYTLHIGTIPNGLLVLHHCDNPKCTNPLDLFIGTDKQNSEDMVNKKRHRFGETSPFAKINSYMVSEIRRRYKEENITMRKLAEDFNIAYVTINNIIHYRKWKHIK